MERARIDDFKQQLEQALGAVFSREELPGRVLLRCRQPAVAVAVYLAGNEGRIDIPAVRSFHIDQDQLLKDPAKICARLCALLGKGRVLYARQTVLARIDKRMALTFLEEHHLQVALPGKYRYGLFHQGELVSVALFSGGRHMRDQAPDYRSFELLRFCSKSGYRVVGGLSKLLKAFITDFRPQDIMTYVDRDWTQHSNLQTLGFEEQGYSAPQAFWIVGKQRYYVPHIEGLDELRRQYPSGYLSHNGGSTKLIWRLEQH